VRLARRAGAAAAGLLLALAARCFGAAAEAAVLAPLAGAAPRVEIEAPPELRALLSRHLDLARLALPSAPRPAEAGRPRWGSSDLAEPHVPEREETSLDDSEWHRLIAAAPAQARDLLRTEGYFEAEVGVRVEAGAPPTVRLSVRPGARVRVAQVAVALEGALGARLAADDPQAQQLAAAVRAAGPLSAGEPFRNSLWSETKQRWLSTLRSAAYASASLRSSAADIDVAAGSARLDGVIDSGPLFLAGPLHIEGLQRHDAATVRHLAGFGPGRPLTEVLLLDFQERLQKSGLFEAVSVGFDPLSELAAAAPVAVRLRELPLQQATVGLGTSTDTGPRASIAHTHRRPFGWAVTADNALEWGRDAQRWNGNLLTHPGAGFARWLVGAQIERERSPTDVVMSQRLRLGRTQDTTALERLAFVEWLRSRQAVTGGPVIDAQAASGNLHLVLRRLDSVLLPTRGYSLSLQLGAGQARSTAGQSGPFVRVQSRFTVYQPLGAQWYAHARIEAGQLVKRDALVVPDALGFRAGGDESVRGYAYRSLAPRIGGNIASGVSLLAASAELARPISATLPSVWGAVFVDAGRAVDRWQDFKPAVGYGFGVRWRSPIGPVRADLAWADELRKARLHLTVGVTF